MGVDSSGRPLVAAFPLTPPAESAVVEEAMGVVVVIVEVVVVVAVSASSSASSSSVHGVLLHFHLQGHTQQHVTVQTTESHSYKFSV